MTVNYEYIDANPLKGVSFYRLQQTDMNGNLHYSPLQSVNNQSVNAVSLTAYPNPFVSSFKLAVNSEMESEMNVVVYDQFGKSVLSTTMALSSGQNEALINIEHIENGIYFVNVQNDNVKQVIRVKKSSAN
jgi:hypothetical protein